MLVHAIPSDVTYDFAADVRDGLLRIGQKELPSKYLYDDVGSALFEVISRLPQYGLTRADERLLRRHASEIVDRLGGPVAVAELGSGSGKKTRWLLEAFCRRQRTSYYPVEISRTALLMCERELSDIDAISIVGFEREYLDGLLEVASYRKIGQRLCVLFLGSTIGNFDRPAGVKFLGSVRSILQPGDALLLGADLEKPAAQLLGAYDDELGVTAAFNLNLLVRINRELGADFDLRAFAHLAKINREVRSVEMHLQSKRRQVANIPGAEIAIQFEEGETIWTESSHKYSAEEVVETGREAGFRCECQWIDETWPFSENLLIAE
ncbi:MAG TPA: L-histidine N(alpha)-methyltransferase [Candidatus Sulfotelmatobacter sp.]|jgi:dimethylhistidine N-methyltransferase|nr:L-histidine N(alpha)-methyltransferase [Candidatus Sulfotelmatobacter sp.]